MSRCFLCGSNAVSAESHFGSPLCEGCLPVKGHVVHMSNPRGHSLAECDCGWRSEVAWKLQGTVQQTKIRMHWRDVIRRHRDAAQLSADSLLDQANTMVGAAVAFVGLLNLLALADVLGRPW